MTYHIGFQPPTDEDDEDDEQQDSPEYSVDRLNSVVEDEIARADEFAANLTGSQTDSSTDDSDTSESSDTQKNDSGSSSSGFTPIEDFRKNNFGSDGVDPYDFVMADAEDFESEKVKEQMGSDSVVENAKAPITALNESADMVVENPNFNIQEANQAYLAAAYGEDTTEKGEKKAAKEFQDDFEKGLAYSGLGVVPTALKRGGFEAAGKGLAGVGNAALAPVSEGTGFLTGVNPTPTASKNSMWMDANKSGDPTEYDPPAHFVLLDAMGLGFLGRGTSTAARGADEAAEAADTAADSTRGSGSVEDFIQQSNVPNTQANTMSLSGLGRFGLRAADDIPADRLARMDFDEFMGASRSVDQSVDASRISDNAIEDMDVSRAFDDLDTDLPGAGPRSVSETASGSAGRSVDFSDEVDDAGSTFRNTFSGFTDNLGLSRTVDETLEGGRWASKSDETGEAAEAAARGSGGGKARGLGRLIDDPPSGWTLAKVGAGAGAAGGTALFADRADLGQSIWQWLGALGDEDGSAPSADAVSGSLVTERQVTAGDGFEITYSLRNTRNKEVRVGIAVTISSANSARGSGQLTSGSGAQTDSEEVLIANFTETLAPNGYTQQTIPAKKTRKVPPGDYTLSLVAATSEKDRQRIDQNSVKVTKPEGGGNGDTPGKTRWSEPEVVSQLAGGWYLMMQAQMNGDERRWLVVGRKQDGTHIYLGTGGRVLQSANTFDTEEKARAAHQAWLERMREQGKDPNASGNGPAAGGPRPEPNRVMKDASEGLLGSLVPGDGGTTTLLALAVVGAGLWYVSDGKPLKYLKGLANEASNTVEAVLPGQ